MRAGWANAPLDRIAMSNVIEIDFTEEGRIRRFQRQLCVLQYGATELAVVVFDGDMPMALRKAAQRELNARLPKDYWMNQCEEELK